MVVGRLAKWTAEDVRAGGGDDGRWAGLKYTTWSHATNSKVVLERVLRAEIQQHVDGVNHEQISKPVLISTQQLMQL